MDKSRRESGSSSTTRSFTFLIRGPRQWRVAPFYRGQSGRTAFRQPELAAGQPARPDAARGLHPAREDHALRPRAHSGAHRARARHGRARLLRADRIAEGYTTAKVLTEVGEKTPVFTRFSTVAGGAGSVDTPRDVRGFAVKFYTKEGNWDLVGNNIPVFFIQDAIKFPDLIHAVKMEPDRGFPQAATAHDTFWDFISLTPESMHMVMWIMSDRTLPRSLRMIEGFGVHSFRLINDAGESTFVKFHWRPKLGLQSTIWDETVKIAGADQDFHRRDMFEAIEAGAFPRVGIRGSAFHAGGSGQIPVRSSRRDQADSRRTGALESDRPHGAGSLAEQFLRRDRAGRVLPVARRAGHRLLERSAAAGPSVLLSRHAAFAPGFAQFPPDPDQRAQVPVRQPAARRTHADGATGGPRCLRAQLAV